MRSTSIVRLPFSEIKLFWGGLLNGLAAVCSRRHRYFQITSGNSASLSCWRDFGAVNLGCDFDAHDFKQHANAPTVV